MPSTDCSEEPSTSGYYIANASCCVAYVTRECSAANSTSGEATPHIDAIIVPGIGSSIVQHLTHWVAVSDCGFADAAFCIDVADGKILGGFSISPAC